MAEIRYAVTVWLAIVCLAALNYKTDAAVTEWGNPVIAAGSLDDNGGGTATVTETIAENLSPGPTGVTIAATGTGTVTFAIKSQNETGKVTMTPAGVISLATGQSFDFDTLPIYWIVVEATDPGDSNAKATATAGLRLSNINEVPIFPKARLWATIPDTSAADTSLLTLNATDPDADSVVAYTIVSGDANSDWKITNDVIKVNTGKTINKTRTEGYELVIRAADNASTPLSATVSVCVAVTDVVQNGGNSIVGNAMSWILLIFATILILQ